jgi:hypothetical protein
MYAYDGDQTHTQPPTGYTRKILLPVLAIVLLGVLLVIWDGRKILGVLRQADLQVIPGTLLFTTISYLCVSYTYALLARMWGIRMRQRDLTEICFVTTSLNHVVRSGGLAGYSVRYLLMSQHGVPFNEVISSSLMHFYLTSLDMLMMMPVALGYILLNAQVPTGVTWLLVLVTLIFVSFAILGTLLVFWSSLRTRVIQVAIRLGNWILRRDFSIFLNDFNQRMAHGIDMLRQHTGRSIFLLSLTFIDWCCSVIVLSLCFDAFGPALKSGAVMASFMIGVMAGVISALPGGIGVQEGSMTGVAMLFGASFEQAILAALLFRVIYYFVPYIISPLFYWRLLRSPAPTYAD